MNDNFDNLKQDKLADTINSYFAPAIDWETEASEMKPVISLKNNSSESISPGDVLYRYRARNGKIQPAEMEKIISGRIARERENLLKVFEAIRKSGTANIGIVNYSNGRFSTPYGVDVSFDRRLVTQVLKKAKYIKEGSFNETEGIPVLKVNGNIDLAEEVPVPDGNPDETHPYIQKQIAKMLDISRQD